MMKGLVSDLNECFSTISDTKNFPLNLLVFNFSFGEPPMALARFPWLLLGLSQVLGWVNPSGLFPTTFVGHFLDCIHSCCLG